MKGFVCACSWSFICISHKNLEQHKYPSIDEQINCEIFIRWNTSLSNKKEETIDTSNNISEFQNNYA